MTSDPTRSSTSPTAQDDARPHLPVMLADVLASLAPKPGEIHIDGTFGAGGYTSAILETGADVIAIDRDATAIERGADVQSRFPGQLRLLHGRFGMLDQHARGLGIEAVDGVVLDIGVSSMQLDQAERGFSFRNDGPLDMRMGQDGMSAADVVNTLAEKELSRIFWVLGEEKRAGALARAIVEDRAKELYTRTRQLASLAERVVGFGYGGKREIHPATRAFQALRIYVNNELGELGEALGAAERILKPGGRLVVVSFHSLEDRIVKRFLAERSRDKAGGSRHAPIVDVPEPTFTLLTKGALAAGDAEIAINPRARSAKLRAGLRTTVAARDVDLADLGVPQLGPASESSPSKASGSKAQTARARTSRDGGAAC
jgi:16S rRNA (cytosine1402-N4)-methyltransferase